MSSHTADSSTSSTGEELSAEELALWRSFLALSVRLTDKLDEQLQLDSGLTITDHEILFSLSEADDQRLRMSDLAEEVLVSRSRLTYRINRLTEVGYVERQACADDRRGLWATLTSKGATALSEAKPAHHEAILAGFIDPIPSEQRGVLAQIFTDMEEKLRSPG